MSNSQILGKQAGLLVRYEWMQEDASGNINGCLVCLTWPGAAGRMATTCPEEIRIIESSNGKVLQMILFATLLSLQAEFQSKSKDQLRKAAFSIES